MKDIEEKCAEFQQALTQGWKEFKQSEEFSILSNFSNFLARSGFYESEYRNTVPHPAYDNGARIIGRHFLKLACESRISFDTCFPGDFSCSTEEQRDENEVRAFVLLGYVEGMPKYRFEIKFSHIHGSFDYPMAPELTIFPV
jgi:hypothetical protein